MRTLAARFAVFTCAVLALAANVPIGGGYLWLGYGVITSATLAAVIATTHMPEDGFRYGVLFAAFAYGPVSGYRPLNGGLTARHVAAFVVAGLVLRAFIGLSVRRNGQELLRKGEAQ